MKVFLRALTISLLLLIPLGIWLAPQVVAFVFGIVFFLAPLWLPVLLFFILIPLWMTFIRSHYVAGVSYTTLELKPGSDTPKTARAMELVFYSLYHRIDITQREAFLTGRVRMPWSFEIYIHGGEVRFFMRVPTAHRSALEARIRSEYRDIDIDEVQDYLRELDFNPFTEKLAIREYTLGKPDPYPIKTYEAYEKGKAPRDTFLEFIESLAKRISEDEHLVISFVVRPHQRDRIFPWSPIRDSLHEDASKEIAALVGSSGDVRSLPESRQAVVRAIEEALEKPSFDVGARAAYIAPRHSYNTTVETSLETLFEVFNDTELNVLVPIDPREKIGWPLSDVFAAVPTLEASHFFAMLRRRSFFSPPYYGKSFVLNTAELATVFHIPKVSRTSPLATQSALEPPQNLPHEPLTAE